ncbi:efflux RND transporter periplasmic adaptor subunit [Prochlorococcus sp. MIT 1341]|uniref:efflux RND transporter periplasmic adaptor subunit n=1 Tax=Prochlorococcus sp. MIT 1341 TaxID=3096221 RepID=UPI002A74E803|nr:efflux RND transporter periplasmic adaptor subunit [Prochlorococcus sp. MIT 1341]
MARSKNVLQPKKIIRSITSEVGRYSSPPRRKKILSISASLLVFSIFAFFARQGVQIFKGGKDLTDFTVAAETGSLPGVITASGEFQAEKSVNVSPDKQGILSVIYVKEGDRVKEGDVLAEMKPGDFQYRLEELRANFETNKLSYQRRNKLFNEGAISAEENDDYRNRFLTSKARLQQREIEGDELFVKAPFEGIVTARYAEPGAFVTPTTRASSSAGSSSSSILELSQGLEISAKVPESDIGRILIGQRASVRVDAFPDKRFSAAVVEIAPRAEKKDNVTSFEVKLSLEDPIDTFRIGMTVDVGFQTGSTAKSTLVPTVAIVTENGQPGLLIVGSDSQPSFQKVELGTSSGSKTVIISGIKPGDLVFIDLPPWANRKRD